MAITFQAAATASASTTTLTLGVPAGTADGDLLLAYVSAYTSTQAASTIDTVPSGWTLIPGSGFDDSSYIHAWVYAKLAKSEPASYIWGDSNCASMLGLMAGYRPDSANSIMLDGQASSQGVDTGSLVASVTAPTVNSDQVGAEVLTIFYNAGDPLTPPGGLSAQRAKATPGGGGNSLSLYDKSFTGEGATGNQTATCSNGYSAGHQVLIREVANAANGTPSLRQTGRGNNSSGGGTSVVATLAFPPTSGNLMVAIVYAGSTSINTPSGWTAIATVNTSGTIAGFYRVVQGGDGVSYTFTTSSASTGVAAFISEWFDGGGGNVTYDTSAAAQNASSSTQAPPTITTNFANEEVISSLIPVTVASFTGLPSLTSLFDTVVTYFGNSAYGGFVNQVAAGISTSQSFTLSAPEITEAITIGIYVPAAVVNVPPILFIGSPLSLQYLKPRPTAASLVGSPAALAARRKRIYLTSAGSEQTTNIYGSAFLRKRQRRTARKLQAAPLQQKRRSRAPLFATGGSAFIVFAPAFLRFRLHKRIVPRAVKHKLPPLLPKLYKVVGHGQRVIEIYLVDVLNTAPTALTYACSTAPAQLVASYNSAIISLGSVVN